jgi:cytochrome c-type biogenesis protein CcmH/NrfF
MRAELRDDLAVGRTVVQIQADYRARFGAAAIAIPSDRGLDRALWAVPVVAIAVGLGGLFVLGRRWSGRASIGNPGEMPAPSGPASVEYDAKLEDELRRFEEP